MKFEFQISKAMTIVVFLFSATAFAKKNDFSLAFKYGLLSAGAEANYDLGKFYVSGGCDLDFYIVGGFLSSFIGIKKYTTESFYFRTSLSYVEDSGKHLYGAGPGLDFVIGNTWTSKNHIIYGAEWIGPAAYYNNLKNRLSFYVHLPKFYIGYAF
jgi:hypothetical protein